MGEWLVNTPTEERINLWRGVPQGVQKVSWWPHPNTPRINCRFRMNYTDPTMIPVCSRWGFTYAPLLGDWDPDDPVRNGFGWWDLDVRGDHHIGLTSPVSPEGFQFELDISSLESLPVHGGPGVFVEIDLTRPVGPMLKQRGEFPVQNITSRFHYHQDTIGDHPTLGWYWLDLDPPEPTKPILNFFGVSECWVFLEEPVGQAAMNGSDAYIALDHNIPSYNGPFFFEADVRIRQDDWNAFLAPQSQNSLIGILDEQGTYSAVRLDLPDFPGFDVWFKYRLEFEWSSGLQLNYRAFINDVLQDERTSNRVSLGFDNIGVRRLGGPAVWGDFDIKHLVLKRGTFASPTTILDMPLLENALDVGPDANHGTTFNMPLPSV